AKPTLASWSRTLRVHQWVKNLLIFVPILTSFSFSEREKVFLTTFAFFSFSFAASATYIANDLWDLENDRAHPRKRFRAFASGTISIFSGITAALALLCVSFLIAVFVLPAPFNAVLLAYIVTTSAYSLLLKGYVLIDVLVLS